VSVAPVYQRGDVLWRRTYDRVLILIPATGEVVTLQATGSDLWGALENPGSIEEVAERLAARYTAAVGQVLSDIEPTLEELRRRGAVTVTDRSR
jgi:hypothetical protein